ncbi:hypothetical protein ACHAPX_006563 [Trichoderma viride]
MPYQPSNYTYDETVASEFVVAKFKPPPASAAPSSSASTTAAVGFGDDSPFHKPQPPRLDGNEKEKACPYCCLVLPARTFSTDEKSKRWERHLLEDLQPYVCLVANCTSPGKTYSSFKAWKSHLSQPHYHSWQCSLHPGDDNSIAANTESLTFNTLVEFKSHLKLYHPDCDPMSANDPSQHVRRRAVLPQWCFVCFKVLPEPAVLLQHMASHFKSMSLLALPWRDDIIDNEAIASDKIVSSSPADKLNDALDTELAGISFDMEEETVNESSIPPEDRLHRLEAWQMELETASEMLGPEEEPNRPPSSETKLCIDRLSPKEPLVFDLSNLENLETSLNSDQSNSLTVKEGNSSVNNRGLSGFNVSVDSLLWVNGHEGCNEGDLGDQPSQRMTLVVLKFTLSSHGRREKFETVWISLQFESSDHEHWEQPTVEAWAPFSPLGTFIRLTAVRKQTNEMNENAASGYFTTGVCRSEGIESELTRPGFGNVFSTIEPHPRTGRPYKVTWHPECNNKEQADKSLEFHAAILVSRSSASMHSLARRKSISTKFNDSQFGRGSLG